jgi:hypothetical protein
VTLYVKGAVHFLGMGTILTLEDGATAVANNASRKSRRNGESYGDYRREGKENASHSVEINSCGWDEVQIVGLSFGRFKV